MLICLLECNGTFKHKGDGYISSVYFEVIKKNFQTCSIYKANSLMYIFTGLLELLVQTSIWYALLGASGTVKGISFSDMVNFVIINLIVNSLVRTSIADSLAEKIRDGSIAIDFIRPINLKWYLISESLGRNIFNTLFSKLPVCVVAVVFLGFKLPSSSAHLVLFLISLLLGIFLSYSINYVLGLFVFWFKTGFHIRWILGAFTDLFAGSIIPLWFYPDLLYNLSKILPFRLISFEPVSIYLGKVSATEAVYTVILQLVWIGGLLLLEKFIWAKAQQAVTVQGG